MSFGSARKRKGEVAYLNEQSVTKPSDEKQAEELPLVDSKWVRFGLFLSLLFGIAVYASRYATLKVDGLTRSSSSSSSETKSLSTAASHSSNDPPYAALRGASSLKDQCTVWMAPSSLKGVNGYGIYTTRNLADGESILGHPDGVSVPVWNYRYTKEPEAVERYAWRKVWKN
jgi:hypothetical protein